MSGEENVILIAVDYLRETISVCLVPIQRSHLLQFLHQQMVQCMADKSGVSIEKDQ